MNIYKIKGFYYSELSENAKMKVKNWLDEIPFDYEDENGITHYEYASDWNDDAIYEHCRMNGYIFNIDGNCIHHLIED